MLTLLSPECGGLGGRWVMLFGWGLETVESFHPGALLAQIEKQHVVGFLSCIPC